MDNDINREINIEQVEFGIDINNIEYSIEINPRDTFAIELNEQGPQGATGPQGPQGEKGEKGDKGETGDIGPIGPEGPQGEVGPQGPQGIQGPQGETGSVGPEGPKGDKGDTGEKGDAATITVGSTTTGLPGTNASVINSGTSSAAILDFVIPRGDKGEQGIQGIQGEQGPKGEQGIQGPKGDTGETGPEGPTGPQGIQGPEGPQGIQGIQGIPGEAATIEVGTVTTGAEGTNVIVVNSGTSQDAVFDFTIPRGNTGSTGPQGPIGPTGPTGNGIDNISLISTVGLQKTYRITYTDGTHYDYIVADGAAGATTWGSITGNLSDQIDLNNALSSKLENKATGINSITIGGYANSNNYGVNIGHSSSCTASGGIAIGEDANVTNSWAISIGGYSNADGYYSISLGTSAETTASRAIQIGSGTNSTANSLQIGFGTNNNYQLLDGTTGFIPDERLSSNIARISAIPTDTADLTNGAGFITNITSSDVTSALGYTPYNSTNPNGYITASALNGYATENFVTSQGYITNAALTGYATETWVSNQGYITGITSGDVTNALGYTPYDASNPNGYTSNIGTVTSVNNVAPVSGNITLSIPSATSDLTNDSNFIQNKTNNSASLEIEGNPVSTGSTYSYSTSVGTNSSASFTGCTAIGAHANIFTSGTYSTAIGAEATVRGASSAIQIGYGTNTTSNSFSVGFGPGYNYQLLDGTTGYIPNDRLLGLLETIYPVGALYIGTTSTCPLASLFGTWTLVAQDKALWTGDGTNADTTIAAGLPNVTGTTNIGGISGTSWQIANTYGNAGAITAQSVSTASYATATRANTAGGIAFNASLSNSIYGNSSTVQPPAYVVNVWKRTA